MKKIIIPIIITTFIAGAGIVHAKHHHERNPEKMVERVTEKLSLDANQQALLQNVVNEKQKLRAERKAKHKQARENGDKKNKGPLAVLAKQDQISVADINRILDEKQAQRRERKQPLLQAFVDFRNSLNAEQRTKAKRIFRKLLRGVIGGHGRKKHHH